MPIRNARQILLAGFLAGWAFSAIGARAQQSTTCQSAYFKVTLTASDDYQRELGGGLLFRIKREKDPAWFVDIVPSEANTKDYIYPVNLPLQLNGNQTLGAGFGETVKSSLSHPHEMNFLLDRPDYDRISAMADIVLHSYQTPDPDKTLSDYSNAVDDARKGWLRITVSSYKADPKTGALTRIKLRVGITTTADFQFAPGVNPWPGPCHR
jgi:hypothetical protein